jgi:hypothetical protein
MLRPLRIIGLFVIGMITVPIFVQGVSKAPHPISIPVCGAMRF